MENPLLSPNEGKQRHKCQKVQRHWGTKGECWGIHRHEAKDEAIFYFAYKAAETRCRVCQQNR